MKLHLKNLQKKIIGMLYKFVITDMYFNWYLDNSLLLNLYDRYFWYLELYNTTQVISAYSNNQLANTLLDKMKGKHSNYKRFWKSAYVYIFDILQNMLFA